MEIASFSKLFGYFIAAILAGMIPAKNPFFAPADLTYEPALVGIFAQRPLDGDAVSIEKDGPNAYRLPCTILDVEPWKLGHRALFDSVVRVEDTLEHDLRFGGNFQIDGSAAHQAEGFAQQAARNVVLVVAEFDVHLGGDEHRRVVPYGDCDFQIVASSLCPLPQLAQVMSGSDAGQESITAFHPQPRYGYVTQARLWVLGNDHTSCDVRSALPLEPGGHRKERRDVHPLAMNDLLHRSFGHDCGLDAVVNGVDAGILQNV